MGMDGQKRSEKWCSRIRRFLRAVIGMFCRWLYSMGMAEGSFPALTALLVDQAKLWADPQATRFIFFPMFQKKKFKWRLPFSKNSYIMSMGIWRELYKRKTGLYTGKIFDRSLSYWLMEHTNAYIVNEK